MSSIAAGVASVEVLALGAPVASKSLVRLEPRLTDGVEAAAYYVVAEGVANVHKHAGASRIVVRAWVEGKTVFVEVLDDGVGGGDREGVGLRGLADRVEALGGTLTLDSPPGAGTRRRAAIPLGGSS